MSIIIRLENIRYELLGKLIKLSDSDFEYRRLIKEEEKLNQQVQEGYQENLLKTPELFINQYENLKERYEKTTYAESIFMPYTDLINYRMYLQMLKTLINHPSYLIDTKLPRQQFLKKQRSKIYSKLYCETKKILTPHQVNELKKKLSFLDDDISDQLLRKQSPHHNSLQLDELMAIDYLCANDCRTLRGKIENTTDRDQVATYQLIEKFLFTQIRNPNLQLVVEEGIKEEQFAPSSKSKIIQFSSRQRR
ncbi:MAG: hypothetical protein PUB18_00380 [bacterium]|nr:hypothetical protein [bacterium]